MRAFDRAPIDDSSGLSEIADFYPVIKPIVSSMKESYQSYLDSSAIGVAPMQLAIVHKEALKLAYESKAKSAGLDWIERLHDSHAFNYCPLCGGAGARTIDHHLPASEYREFSVYSYNLLPSCDSCNRKRNNFNKFGALTTLHPFFDSSSLEFPILSTYIEPPYEAPNFQLKLNLPGDDRDSRISNHVEKSIDLVAYRTWTLGAWGDIKLKVAPRHSDEGSLARELRQDLVAETRGGNRNSWNAALVRGLLKNEEARAWLVANAVPIEELSDLDLGID